MRVRHELIAVPDDEMAGGAEDVDAVIGIGSVAEDALVLFIERIHRAPCERHGVVAQRASRRRRLDMLPGAALGGLTVAADDVEPSRLPEIRVAALVVCGNGCGRPSRA
jgi:hypothetical protein